MASIAEARSPGRRQGRRWRFGSALLDEAGWTLSVDGDRVQIETKPLQLLHELLLRAGEVVTKEELLDAVWPGVSVVEASLPTAVNKLRRVLGDDAGGTTIIETVRGFGYRLAVPVEMIPSQPETTPSAPESPAAPSAARSYRWPVIAGGVAVALTAGTLVFATMTRTAAAPASAPAFTQRDVDEAIRHLDVERIERLLRAGWDPNTPINDKGDGAMTMVLNICEWNPGHDKARLLLMARTLMEAGVRIDQHNGWGDSPYSIAKAKRYCGPEHPVTKMMWAQCYTGYKPPGDKCLATYERTGDKAR